MGQGGATRKMIIDGLNFELSSDNDMNLTMGGRTITEIQDTTGKPFYLSDKITGIIAGAEARLGLADGTLINFNNIIQKCADGEAVSFLWEAADKGKLTSAEGVMIKPTDAAGGSLSTREGKFSFDVSPVSGEFTPA